MCAAPGLHRIRQYLLASSGQFTKDSMKEFGGKICKKCDLFLDCERRARGWGHNEAITSA